MGEDSPTSQHPPSEFALSLKNRVAEIPALHHKVSAFCAGHAIPGNVTNAVNVSLEEILVNIITHGYEDQNEHEIAVYVSLAKGRVLRLCVEDDAMPFNPLEAKAPDTAQDVSERPLGGLGILLTRKLMDQVRYVRARERNRLLLEKNIDGG
ncbi:ATP-binding protein [Elusimicrobiota bacterium]